MTVSGAGDYTQKLRDRVESMVGRAEMLLSVADAIDAVTKACDMQQITCSGPCKRCPAYVGHPGMCLFVRLDGVIGDYLDKHPAGEQPNCDPVIEVP